MDMKSVQITVSVAMVCIAGFCSMHVEGRLRELEQICAYEPSDNLDVEEIVPTPDDIIRKYGATTNDVVRDLWTLTAMYSPSETNSEKRVIRETAVAFIGQYGDTNDLARLSTIMTNGSDYAQESALLASFCLLEHSPDLISFARCVVTNATVYSPELRGLTYVRLIRLCEEGKSDDYIDDAAQHTRIAGFFLERAAVEQNDILFIDRCAYTLNPSYRHSQQRRDNLAALRPPNLTGKRAELYDAVQADAAQED